MQKNKINKYARGVWLLGILSYSPGWGYLSLLKVNFWENGRYGFDSFYHDTQWAHGKERKNSLSQQRGGNPQDED